MGILWILIPYGEGFVGLWFLWLLIPYGKGIENHFIYIYVERFPHSIRQEEENSHIIIPRRG